MFLFYKALKPRLRIMVKNLKTTLQFLVTTDRSDTWFGEQFEKTTTNSIKQQNNKDKTFCVWWDDAMSWGGDEYLKTGWPRLEKWISRWRVGRGSFISTGMMSTRVPARMRRISSRKRYLVNSEKENNPYYLFLASWSKLQPACYISKFKRRWRRYKEGGMESKNIL